MKGDGENAEGRWEKMWKVDGGNVEGKWGKMLKIDERGTLKLDREKC